jgi:hypothetical protein
VSISCPGNISPGSGWGSVGSYQAAGSSPGPVAQFTITGLLPGDLIELQYDAVMNYNFTTYNTSYIRMEVRGNAGGATTPLGGSESSVGNNASSTAIVPVSGCGVYALPSGNTLLSVWLNGYSIYNANANAWIVREGNIIAKVWRAA